MLSSRQECADFIRSIVKTKQGHGLEISPDLNPIIRKDGTSCVQYLDVCDTERLRQKAIDRGRPPESAPLIDHLLDYEKPLSECVEGSKFDYVISSHVLEHIPNPIGHFNQINEILTPQGLYILLVPNKRLCFDCLKPDSSLGQLLEAHILNHHSAPVRAMVDEFYYGVKRGQKGGWSESDETPHTPKYADSRSSIMSILRNPSIASRWHGHIWNFTPESFQKLYTELCLLSLTSLKLKKILPSTYMEFVIILESP